MLDKSEIARGLLKTFGSTMKKKNCRKLIHNLLDVTWEVTVSENKTTITAAEFVESDGLADTVRGTLSYIKQFGDESFDSEEPLQSPTANTEHAAKALQIDDAENGLEFSGHYHQRSLKEHKKAVNMLQPLSKKKQLQDLRSSRSLGNLVNYTPEQLAGMNTCELAVVLEDANLLKTKTYRRSKSRS